MAWLHAFPFLGVLAIAALRYACVTDLRFNNSQYDRKPNVVIIFADDLGYGDLSCFGHPTSHTPFIDEMANKGLVFTQFYSTSPVCSPSRASLLTGRYQTRSGIYPDVFSPGDIGGLPHNETTIAEFLGRHGYKSAAIGKWHLGVGVNGTYLPTNHGFDEYYGIPYSHDMCPCPVCFYPDGSCIRPCRNNEAPCPLFGNTTIVEQPADLISLTKKHIDKATDFIKEATDARNPFFLYYASYQTHHPQFAGQRFTNSSIRGAFGDALAELDWSVGMILKTVKDAGIENNTYVFFTSDNGPSMTREIQGGSAGLLKCCKGTTYEGGMRVPAIAYWPGVIPPGRTHELASTLDLLPTIATLLGKKPPLRLDGVDMEEILLRHGKSKRDTFFYYPVGADPRFGVFAVRYKQYKAHFWTKGSGLCGQRNPDDDCRITALRTKHNPPLLFDLDADPAERYNINKSPKGKRIIPFIAKLKKKFDERMKWGTSQIRRGANNTLIPCCNPGCTPFPQCCHCERGKSSLVEMLWKYVISDDT
ncbi:PREDICTED: arylsulfatase A-like [Priapulus caudatus]|uniref:Arylsulfatase A-like n=1 Tax=Priapulus caudatus TaxID=37621 RepID=A0ABM1DTJ4_PRICU|nr:PREDICTED: arylsulfatase A-like [Priapulus caudatus]